VHVCMCMCVHVCV